MLRTVAPEANLVKDDLGARRLDNRFTRPLRHGERRTWLGPLATWQLLLSPVRAASSKVFSTLVVKVPSRRARGTAISPLCRGRGGGIDREGPHVNVAERGCLSASVAVLTFPRAASGAVVRAVVVSVLLALRSDPLDGRPGAEASATDCFSGSILDVELASVQLVVVQVEESARRLRSQVKVDKRPA